jgi:branched-chain amino acid transport system substrate-binding protein
VTSAPVAATTSSPTATTTQGTGAANAAAPTATSTSAPGTGSTGPGSTGSTGSTGTGSTGATGTAGGKAKPQPAASTKASVAPTSGGQSATCTAAGSPLVLGEDGEFSGFVGEVTSGMRTGVAVWAKDVNSRGGVACHPVQVFQSDNGSSQTKAGSDVTDFITNKKVQAFVGSPWPIVMDAVTPLLEKYKVPALGGDGANGEWVNNPYLFTVGTGPYPLFAGALKEMRLATGQTKVGLLYCVEASLCASIHSSAAGANGFVNAAGMQLVFSQAASLTQPDFTAECQNMKNAGVQDAFLAMDGGAIQRFIRSCTQIGYKVPLATIGLALSTALLTDPSAASWNIYAPSQTAPFIASGVPAVAAYQAAMKRYAPGQGIDTASLIGWTSGKMLEAAVQHVPGAQSQPITSAMVLQGLWSLRDETLDGLVPGLTFTQGNPSPNVTCYYPMLMQANAWAAPAGGQKHCL